MSFCVSSFFFLLSSFFFLVCFVCTTATSHHDQYAEWVFDTQASWKVDPGRTREWKVRIPRTTTAKIFNAAVREQQLVLQTFRASSPRLWPVGELRRQHPRLVLLGVQGGVAHFVVLVGAVLRHVVGGGDVRLHHLDEFERTRGEHFLFALEHHRHFQRGHPVPLHRHVVVVVDDESIHVQQSGRLGGRSDGFGGGQCLSNHGPCSTIAVGKQQISFNPVVVFDTCGLFFVTSLCVLMGTC